MEVEHDARRPARRAAARARGPKSGCMLWTCTTSAPTRRTACATSSGAHPPRTMALPRGAARACRRARCSSVPAPRRDGRGARAGWSAPRPTAPRRPPSGSGCGPAGRWGGRPPGRLSMHVMASALTRVVGATLVALAIVVGQAAGLAAPAARARSRSASATSAARLRQRALQVPGHSARAPARAVGRAQVPVADRGRRPVAGGGAPHGRPTPHRLRPLDHGAVPQHAPVVEDFAETVTAFRARYPWSGSSRRGTSRIS